MCPETFFLTVRGDFLFSRGGPRSYERYFFPLGEEGLSRAQIRSRTCPHPVQSVVRTSGFHGVSFTLFCQEMDFIGCVSVSLSNGWKRERGTEEEVMVEEEEEEGGLNSFSLRTKHSGNHPGEPNRAEGGGVGGETLP